MRIEELDTPALLIDVDVMERNLRRVADYARSHGLRLRPHTKTHKIPALGRKQLDLGAAGLTVAKTTEGEVMMQAHPAELLVAYPVIGAAKLERLMRLSAQTDVTVSVDGACAARGISAAAQAAGRTVGVLAEVDAGLGRVGVKPGAELLELARTIAALPGVDFRGIAFYPGHIKDVGGGAAEAQLAELNRTVTDCVGTLERAGLEVRIVSGGSTPALYYSHCIERMNEIRPGTYIFNDRNTWLTGGCGLGDCAASVLTTVVSTAVPGRTIIDGGSKTFSSDRCAAADAPGFGYLPEAPERVFDKMNEEHGYLDTSTSGHSWKVGDRIRVIPNHVCVAMNLHEKVYGVRGEDVVEVWTVAGRGRLQ